MKLYLSSFRLGNQPKELLRLLAGKRRTVVIMNAVDFGDDAGRARKIKDEMERLRSLGLDLHELDLRDYFDNPDALKAELQNYDCVWVRGGNVFILRRAFRQSGADKILPELIQNESIVYAGYSAGVCILMPHLHGIELVDDPHLLSDGYNPGIIWDCLNLLPYCVAPHYKSDHPESADIEKMVDYYIEQHIPFVALKDGQAIVIDGESQKFVG